MNLHHASALPLSFDAIEGLVRRGSKIKTSNLVRNRLTNPFCAKGFMRS
jgi:hypothetical protein